MTFSCSGDFGPSCVLYYEDDPSNLGSGSSRPAGFTLAQMMELYWQANNLAVTSADFFADAAISCLDNDAACDCLSQSNLSNPSPAPNPRNYTTRAGIMCGGAYLAASYTDPTDGSNASIVIDMSSIAVDLDFDDPDFDADALYYPLITVTINGVDGGSTCAESSEGDNAQCQQGGATSASNPFSVMSIGTCALQGPAWTSPVGVDLFPTYGFISAGSGDYNPYPCQAGGGDGYGGRECGTSDPVNSTDCPNCGQGPICGEPLYPGGPNAIKPDCDDADCPTKCVPLCCSPLPEGCWPAGSTPPSGYISCVQSGCGTGLNQYDPPCFGSFASCSIATVTGSADMTVKWDTSITNF